MGYRNCGVVQPPEQGAVLTCNVCEHDIVYEDRRSDLTSADTAGNGA
jgi:hypothetical protein